MTTKREDKIRNDEYYTRAEAVIPLIKHLKPNSTIWAPADKDWSLIVKMIREAGHKVICTHIDDGQDFLTYTPDFEFDYIITNPPYSIRKQFLLKALEYGKPFAFLVPLVSIALKDFRMILDENVFIINFEERLKYWQNDPNEKIAGSSETGWFTYGFNTGKAWELVRKEGQ